jgi:hypothetical protein
MDCRIPIEEERSYWEEYFDLLSVKDAHARRNCRDLNGTEPWACSECDCTRRLEEKLQSAGGSFLTGLRREPRQNLLRPAATLREFPEVPAEK